MSKVKLAVQFLNFCPRAKQKQFRNGLLQHNSFILLLLNAFSAVELKVTQSISHFNSSGYKEIHLAVTCILLFGIQKKPALSVFMSLVFRLPKFFKLIFKEKDHLQREFSKICYIY